MFCSKCGKEIETGQFCDSCMSVAPKTDLSQVNPAVTLRLIIFGFLGMIPLSNLFINIINYEMVPLMEYYMSESNEGFSFYVFVTTFSEFKVLEGTSGYVFTSMIIMLFAGVKLLSVSINAFLWCKKSKKLKKAYTGLYKWCEGFGILSLIATGVNYIGHKNALEELKFTKLMEISIPVPFIALSIFAIALGIVIKVFYKTDADKLV